MTVLTCSIPSYHNCAYATPVPKPTPLVRFPLPTGPSAGSTVLVIPNSLFPLKTACRVGFKTLQSNWDEAYVYAADEQDRLEFWGMEMRAEGEVAESSEDGKREVHAWVEVQTVTDGASQAISRQCQTSPAGKFQN
jgi:hypothetical protein